MTQNHKLLKLQMICFQVLLMNHIKKLYTKECYELKEKSEKIFSRFKLEISNLDQICIENAKATSQMVKWQDLEKIKKEPLK